MELQEYEKVKSLSYSEYCQYLKGKYGESKYNYFTPNFSYVGRISRTKEGLYCHHICECYALDLSEKKQAKKYPYEYQNKENLVYCNLLEHLFLHILIFKEYYEYGGTCLGIMGIFAYLCPTLNDMYCWYVPKQEWELNCYNAIINHKDTYLAIMKDFVNSDKFLNCWIRKRDRKKPNIKQEYIDIFCHSRKNMPLLSRNMLIDIKENNPIYKELKNL